MTQEDKELLLKDLCARVPYKVNALMPDEYGGYTSVIESIDIDGFVVDFEGVPIEIEFIKPCLYPRSSMTEEQEKDIFRNGTFFFDRHNTLCRFPKHNDDCDYVTFEDYLEITEKLNKHHIDYRGLIEKGLALDATNLNIY